MLSLIYELDENGKLKRSRIYFAIRKQAFIDDYVNAI